MVNRYKQKTDKNQTTSPKTSSTFKDIDANMDGYDTPVKSRSQRRPSVQKKLDVAFAQAKAEKQKLTVDDSLL